MKSMMEILRHASTALDSFVQFQNNHPAFEQVVDKAKKDLSNLAQDIKKIINPHTLVLQNSSTSLTMEDNDKERIIHAYLMSTLRPALYKVLPSLVVSIPDDKKSNFFTTAYKQSTSSLYKLVFDLWNEIPDKINEVNTNKLEQARKQFEEAQKQFEEEKKSWALVAQKQRRRQQNYEKMLGNLPENLQDHLAQNGKDLTIQKLPNGSARFTLTYDEPPTYERKTRPTNKYISNVTPSLKYTAITRLKGGKAIASFVFSERKAGFFAFFYNYYLKLQDLSMKEPKRSLEYGLELKQINTANINIHAYFTIFFANFFFSRNQTCEAIEPDPNTPSGILKTLAEEHELSLLLEKINRLESKKSQDSALVLRTAQSNASIKQKFNYFTLSDEPYTYEDGRQLEDSVLKHAIMFFQSNPDFKNDNLAEFARKRRADPKRNDEQELEQIYRNILNPTK